MDIFNVYIMGCAQMLLGFAFFVRLLHERVRLHFYLLFAVCGMAVMHFVPAGRIAEFGIFVLLLMASGIFICADSRRGHMPLKRRTSRAAGREKGSPIRLQGPEIEMDCLRRTDWKAIILYAALAVEIMQLCYGMIDSLTSILYMETGVSNHRMMGIVIMLSGNIGGLLLTGFCYCVVYHYFLDYEAVKRQYVFIVLIPILMMFLIEEYINSILYSIGNCPGFQVREANLAIERSSIFYNTIITDETGIVIYANHYQMLAVQLLGMASLFCILFAYKKLLQNFRFSTELSLLEQEEHSLRQYVDEAKIHYEKTASFRHDIKNHIMVIKGLLQSEKWEQVLHYIGDLEEMAEELSFPCSTNNPVVDILAGEKLGIAKSLGIDVDFSLTLPYPCGLRDIDICIILSNALDNAIQACKNMDAGAEKQIRVTGRIQGDFFFMEIENSFQGKGFYKEGTGLSNVKAVAEKYHGAVNIKVQDDIFSLNVLLIIPQHSDNSPQQMDLFVDVSGRKK